MGMGLGNTIGGVALRTVGAELCYGMPKGP